MIEGRETEEKEKRNAVVGDAMRNMRVFFVRGECGEGDINAMVSGGMRIDGRVKNKRANVLKK